MVDLKHIAEGLRALADEIEAGLPTDSLADYAEVPPPRVISYEQVAKAFKARYEEARQMEWFLPRNTQDCIDLALWINTQAIRDKRSPKDVGAQLLDNFFKNERCRTAGYPIAFLAKDPGAHYRPAAEDGRPSEEERHRRGQEAERRYQAALAESEAAHAQKVRERGVEAPELSTEDQAALDELKESFARKVHDDRG